MNRAGIVAAVALIAIAVVAWPLGGARFTALLPLVVVLAEACVEIGIRSGSTDADAEEAGR